MSGKDGCSFTVKQLTLSFNISDQRCRQILNHFVTRRYITKDLEDGLLTYQARAGARPVFNRSGRPTGQGVNNRTKKSARQRIWNSLKILNTCSMDQIMLTSDASLNSVSKYMQALEKAGYVKCTNRRKQPDGRRKVVGKYRVYMLLRNTGRLYPIVRGEGCWDQNQQNLYSYHSKGKEDSDEQVA